MRSDHLLHRLADALEPSGAERSRVQQRIARRLAVPQPLVHVVHVLTPSARQRMIVWQRVIDRCLQTVRIAPHLAPQSLLRSLGFGWMRMTVALVVLAVLVRVSPLLLLAPRISADSPVRITALHGSFSLSLHDLWQSFTDTIELNEGGIALRTDDGEAAVLLHDDGSIRFAPHTQGVLGDIADRPAVTAAMPTLTLMRGAVWVQGLLPDHIVGLVIATPHGTVTVRGGSVSISVTDRMRVSVWDRSAVVVTGATETVLVAGDVLENDGIDPLVIRTLSAQARRDTWVAGNIAKDALYRREIAQAQQERRAAAAGILPTSPLYPAKRIAEQVDLFLTLSQDARMEKRLQLASTRFNEAAALLGEDTARANASLQEYRDAILLVSLADAGSGSTLLADQLSDGIADVGAALPEDEAYPLKTTLLEASAALPQFSIDARDVRATVLLDALHGLHDALDKDDAAAADASLQMITTNIFAIEDGSLLRPQAQREAVSLLRSMAYSVQKGEQEHVSAPVVAALAPYAPKEPRTVVTQRSMTDEELKAAVTASINRIFYQYKMPQSRRNQLVAEIRAYQKNVDRGRYLHALYYAVPEGSDLLVIVRKAIQQAREHQIARDLGLVHDAAGGDATGSGEELGIRN